MNSFVNQLVFLDSFGEPDIFSHLKYLVIKDSSTIILQYGIIQVTENNSALETFSLQYGII